MKMNRSLTEFVVGIAVLAAIIVFEGCVPAPQAKNSSPAAGMGDVHRVESQQSIPVTGEENSILPPYQGMGEWKRFEEQQAKQDTGDQATGHTYFGTGDPLKYRVPQKSGQTNPGLKSLDAIPGGR